MHISFKEGTQHISFIIHGDGTQHTYTITYEYLAS